MEPVVVMRTRTMVLLSAALACCLALTLQACANSILRNAAEAGVETVLEGPLPTPTVAEPSSP